VLIANYVRWVKPNEAVEKLFEGPSKSFFVGHSTHPNMMIVKYSAF
jgi:hypothetical protein